MDALEFMRELKRMCTFYDCCVDCSSYNKGCKGDSRVVFKSEKEMILLINDVEKWGKDNPIEIDWLKVPRNTPVLVRDVVDSEWQEERFCAYFPYPSEIRNQFITFDTEEQYATDINYWRYCKLAPEVDPTPYLKEVK